MFSIKTELDPSSAVPVSVRALEKAPFDIKQRASKTMSQHARKITSAATSAAKTRPSGLWRNAGSPRYRVIKDTMLSVSVGTPGGAVGKAEAISEFAAKGGSGGTRNSRYYPPRPDLARTLTGIYGRAGGAGGGRILWRVYDDGEDDYIKSMEDTVDKFAQELQQKVNS